MSALRGIAIGLMVIGALLLAFSLFADALGIGSAGGEFGWRQVTGAMLGAGICLGGARGWWQLARTRGCGTEREG